MTGTTNPSFDGHRKPDADLGVHCNLAVIPRRMDGVVTLQGNGAELDQETRIGQLWLAQSAKAFATCYQAGGLAEQAEVRGTGPALGHALSHHLPDRAGLAGLSCCRRHAVRRRVCPQYGAVGAGPNQVLSIQAPLTSEPASLG